MITPNTCTSHLQLIRLDMNIPNAMEGLMQHLENVGLAEVWSCDDALRQSCTNVSTRSTPTEVIRDPSLQAVAGEVFSPSCLTSL